MQSPFIYYQIPLPLLSPPPPLPLITPPIAATDVTNRSDAHLSGSSPGKNDLGSTTPRVRPRSMLLCAQSALSHLSRSPDEWGRSSVPLLSSQIIPRRQRATGESKKAGAKRGGKKKGGENAMGNRMRKGSGNASAAAAGSAAKSHSQAERGDIRGEITGSSARGLQPRRLSVASVSSFGSWGGNKKDKEGPGSQQKDGDVQDLVKGEDEATISTAATARSGSCVASLDIEQKRDGVADAAGLVVEHEQTAQRTQHTQHTQHVPVQQLSGSLEVAPPTPPSKDVAPSSTQADESTVKESTVTERAESLRVHPSSSHPLLNSVATIAPHSTAPARTSRFRLLNRIARTKMKTQSQAQTQSQVQTQTQSQLHVQSQSQPQPQPKPQPQTPCKTPTQALTTNRASSRDTINNDTVSGDTMQDLTSNTKGAETQQQNVKTAQQQKTYQKTSQTIQEQHHQSPSHTATGHEKENVTITPAPTPRRKRRPRGVQGSGVY